MRMEYFTDSITGQPEFFGYSLQPAGKFSQNELFYLTNEGRPGSKSFYLKIFIHKPNQFPEDLPIKKVERELLVAQFIKERVGINTPQSIFLGQNELGDTAILQEEIVGITLDQLIQQHNILRRGSLLDVVYQAGISLARIHALMSTLYGDVLPGCLERYSSWAECFTVDVRKRLSKGMRLGVLNQRHIDYFEERLNSPVLNTSGFAPTLCHNDFGPKNIILDTESAAIVGLLDFEEARYWIPEWDLTRVNAALALEHPGENHDLWNSFINGYASQEQQEYIEEQISYYKPFESLHYWIWGWNYSRLRTDIKKDIIRVTKIP